MSKHRKAKSKKKVLAPTVMVGAAAGLSAALVLGSGPANAAELTVIGVGGASNPNGDRIPPKLQGGVGVLPDLSNYIAVNYPATVPIDDSVNEARPILVGYIKNGQTDDPNPRTITGPVRIVGYSEGSVVAELAKRDLENGPIDPDISDVDFWFIASPSVPNGGFYSRFPWLSIPGFENIGAAAPSKFDQTFITAEYDGIADFPAYANPLSIANAVAGIAYRHGDATPDSASLNPGPDDPKVVKKVFVKDDKGTADPDDDSTDTYYLLLADELPLFAPVRQVSTALNTTQFTEPVLDGIEPVTKLFVDMGYTDRDLSTANKPTQFSLITPPERIVETVSKVPAAIQQGATQATTDIETGSADSTLAASAKAPAKTKSAAPQLKIPTVTAPKLPSLLGKDGNKAEPKTAAGGSKAKNDPVRDAVKQLKKTFSPKQDDKPAASDNKTDAA